MAATDHDQVIALIVAGVIAFGLALAVALGMRAFHRWQVRRANRRLLDSRYLIHVAGATPAGAVARIVED